jgi:hypothetical protein
MHTACREALTMSRADREGGMQIFQGVDRRSECDPEQIMEKMTAARKERG